MIPSCSNPIYIVIFVLVLFGFPNLHSFRLFRYLSNRFFDQSSSYPSYSSSSSFHSSLHAMNQKSKDSFTFKAQELDLINVYESRRESVAYISTLSQAFNPLLMNMMEIPRLTGSGFVWNEGYIVTNNHVIDGQKEVLVTFVNITDGSRQSYRAIVRGGEKEKDIAVLKVIKPLDKTLPPPLPLANSNKLIVGQFVAAIGNPFGLDQTLTSDESNNNDDSSSNNTIQRLLSLRCVGIVSGLGRQIRTQTGNVIYDMIQTDAAINPGNSGGPLLDSSGRLIGMNTAIYSTTGAFSGVGFAIPVDILKVVVSSIIKNGTFVKPNTGIQFVGGYQAKLLGVEDGLLVLSIDSGSPAERAGLRAVPKTGFGLVSSEISSADIILRVNGKSVRTEADFFQAIYSKVVGDTIELSVKRSISSNSEISDSYLLNSNNIDRKRIFREVDLLLKLN